MQPPHRAGLKRSPTRNRVRTLCASHYLEEGSWAAGNAMDRLRLVLQLDWGIGSKEYGGLL